MERKEVMPYIKDIQKKAIDQFAVPPSNSGELNYMLTKMCLYYLSNKQVNYSYYNDVIGALEACKLEFYRRAIAPYEDRKIEENGDVY